MTSHPMQRSLFGGSIGAPVRVVETHSAVVLFVGDRAYKLKKPVDLDFLDFSTLAARAQACRDEVSLNRRLAPDVYLGVADVIGEDGELCDHMVVMRRLPDDRRLTSCIEHGEDVSGALDEIAAVIVDLHESEPADPAWQGLATVDAVRANWVDGFEQLHAMVGQGVDDTVCERIEELVEHYLDGRQDLFDTRIAMGRVRDGHGDLQADDIFLLDDAPRVLDCIEFGDRYRRGDVLNDFAFLSMDLERLGRPDLARQFLATCRDLSGDGWPPSLADHYIAYRAHVRAKVKLLRQSQDGDYRGPAVDHLLHLALDHLERGRVRLVLVGGLPGTGKSTVAKGLGSQLDAVVLRSDVVRRHAVPEMNVDRYSQEAVQQVYDALLADARRLLRLGHHVVLDATWANADHREAARRVASETSSDIVELACVAPSGVAAERIRRRVAEGTDPSEATPVVAQLIADRFDRWPEASNVDTTMTVAGAVARATALASRTSLAEASLVGASS